MLAGMPSPPIPHVRVARRPDGVAHVVLDRPAKLNALTLEMLDGLVRTARALGRDDTVRAVVLSGEGNAYCAGLDLRAALRDPVGIGHRFLPRPWRGTNVFQEACWAWRRLPVPVVAAVHGHCLGAGIQLALGADLRTSTPDASWSVREVRWGLVPDMTGIRSLAELVGVDVAKELTLSGRLVPGSEAHDLGLVTRTGTDPVAEARTLLEPMLAHDRTALARAKRLFTTSWHASPRATFARERRAQLGLLGRLARDRSSLPGGTRPTTSGEGAGRGAAGHTP